MFRFATIILIAFAGCDKKPARSPEDFLPFFDRANDRLWAAIVEVEIEESGDPSWSVAKHHPEFMRVANYIGSQVGVGSPWNEKSTSPQASRNMFEVFVFKSCRFSSDEFKARAYKAATPIYEKPPTEEFWRKVSAKLEARK